MKWNETIAVFGFVEVAFQIFPVLEEENIAFLVPLFKIKTRHKDAKQKNMYKAKVNF